MYPPVCIGRLLVRLPVGTGSGYILLPVLTRGKRVPLPIVVEDGCLAPVAVAVDGGAVRSVRQVSSCIVRLYVGVVLKVG